MGRWKESERPGMFSYFTRSLGKRPCRLAEIVYLVSPPFPPPPPRNQRSLPLRLAAGAEVLGTSLLARPDSFSRQEVCCTQCPRAAPPSLTKGRGVRGRGC